MWIGWPGITGEEGLHEPIPEGTKAVGYTLKPVLLNREEHDKFYYGFSNEVVWPLFHDLQDRCNFDPEYWDAYLKVNGKYAEVIAESTSTNDFIWVHDYHLMYVAQALRESGVRAPIGFFPKGCVRPRSPSVPHRG
ncbi:trehalose-6-phosphate synthase [Thermodesulfobacteriota bacterium]